MKINKAHDTVLDGIEDRSTPKSSNISDNGKANEAVTSHLSKLT